MKKILMTPIPLWIAFLASMVGGMITDLIRRFI